MSNKTQKIGTAAEHVAAVYVLGAKLWQTGKHWTKALAVIDKLLTFNQQVVDAGEPCGVSCLSDAFEVLSKIACSCYRSEQTQAGQRAVKLAGSVFEKMKLQYRQDWQQAEIDKRAVQLCFMQSD